MKREIKKGNVVKWRGIRNSDTGEIDSGYLYFAIVDGGGEMIGKSVKAKNRKEAICIDKLESQIENLKEEIEGLKGKVKNLEEVINRLENQIY